MGHFSTRARADRQRLSSGRAGGFAVSKHLNIENNSGALAELSNLVVPSLDVWRVSRRIRVGQVAVAITVGQALNVVATVPLDQMWVMRAVTYFHSDSGTHIVHLRRVAKKQGNASISFDWTRSIIRPDVTTNVYPGTPLDTSSASTELFFNQRIDLLEAMPGDDINFIDETGLAQANDTPIWRFEYEILPPPVEYLGDEEFNASVV